MHQRVHNAKQICMCCESLYRVTIQLVMNLPLNSKQKFRFGLARPGENGTFVLQSTGGSSQAEWSPCTFHICRNVLLDDRDLPAVDREHYRHSRGITQPRCVQRILQKTRPRRVLQLQLHRRRRRHRAGIVLGQFTIP